MRKWTIGIIAAISVAALGIWWMLKKDSAAEQAAIVYKRQHGKLISFDRVIILGVPLTGKTYFAAQLTKDCTRVIYFDPCGDYARYGATEFTVDELEAAQYILRKPAFKIAVRPNDDDSASMADDLERTVRLCRSVGHMTIVLDEVGDYCQEGARTINKLFRNGRHDDIVTILVSQVATDIPKTCRRIATKFYSFLQEDPGDLDALEEKCGSNFREKVRAWNVGNPPAYWELSTLSSLKDRNGKH